MTTYQRGDLIYEGKTKKIFGVKDHSELVVQEFKNSLTAFNGVKKAEMEEKGTINRQIASLIFRYLKKSGVRNQWVADLSDHEMVAEKLQIIPVEVIIRNRVAGSFAKRFRLPEGQAFSEPLLELCLKSDELGDPFINDQLAMMFGKCTLSELELVKKIALKVNKELRAMFAAVNIDLVDFKLEFGRDKRGEIVLGDEITPDSCRLWDSETEEILDKDRFRRDLGRVQESYVEVLKRLKTHWEKNV